MKSDCLSWSDKKVMKRARVCLRDNGVILSSTDTVLGLMARVSYVGKKLLDSIKKREEKPYIVLIASLLQVRSYIADDCLERIGPFARVCWPGPLTLVVAKRQRTPAYYGSVDGTLALRVPAHETLRLLCAAVGPLFSTSANKSGCSVPLSIDEVDDDIMRQVNLVIRDQLQGENSTPLSSLASTVLDCRQDIIKVLRKGAYPIDMLERAYGGSFSIID